MAYSYEVKEEALNRMKNGEKISEISKSMGIAKTTLYNWKKKSVQHDNRLQGEDSDERIIQEIEELIKARDYEAAKDIGTRFFDNAKIQSKMVTIAIKEKDYERAKAIGERFPKDAKIQSKMITIAIKEGKYKRAKDIGERFPEDAVIQSQMLAIAIKKEDYEKVKAIGERFLDYAPIQSQMVTIAIKEKNYKRAKDIGERFFDNGIIQSQMVTIAIKEKDYKRAKDIGERFPEDAVIQSQMVTIAIIEEDYEGAKDIGKRFLDYAPIQSQMVTIAIIEEDYEGAKDIGERFPKDAIIQSQMVKIANGVLNYLKTQLYGNNIDSNLVQEIVANGTISDFQKAVVLVAMYERLGIKEIAKKILKGYSPQNEEEKKAISIIRKRIRRRKNQIFDWGEYDAILGWEINPELAKEIEEQQTSQDNSKKSRCKLYRESMRVQVPTVGIEHSVKGKGIEHGVQEKGIAK